MMCEHLIQKAKEAKSADELIAIAKENGVELSAEEAKNYFEQLNTSRELSDDELDNVSGGACVHEWGGTRLVVTIGDYCKHWTCGFCHQTTKSNKEHKCSVYKVDSADLPVYCNCNSFLYMTYERGVWYCEHPANRKT